MGYGSMRPGIEDVEEARQHETHIYLDLLLLATSKTSTTGLAYGTVYLSLHLQEHRHVGSEWP